MSHLYADLLRSAVRELDAKAKTISGHAFVTLSCWPEEWRVNVYNLVTGKAVKTFGGQTPQEALDRAGAFVREHDPDAVVAALGLASETSIQTA